MNNKQQKDQTKPLSNFPIVGIGASAGGLETFSEMLSYLPKDCGIAIVYISHLDPNHKSMMVELIARKTSIPVSEATPNMAVSPNHIYVIPPNKYMTIVNGKLKLTPRTAFVEQHMPIDYFFRSLASDQKERAIGIVLSGTASDGALGLQEIRNANGITLVQDPQRALYASMPRAAIAAGTVDYMLNPQHIAKELVRIGKLPYTKDHDNNQQRNKKEKNPLVPNGETDLRRVFSLLRFTTGVDFTDYKRSTLLRRIERRVILKKKSTFEEYVNYLKDNREEIVNLYQDLLITVTKFFRDPPVFEELKKQVFPALVKNRARGDVIRIWVAGCSGGEEAYSVLICLLEFLEENGLTFPIQLFATDLSDKEIAKARTGLYIENIALDVMSSRLKRFFVKENNHYLIHKYIRDMCVFAKHDLTVNPPFSSMDIVSCRNVLIYMEQVLQNKIIPLFHFALKPQGFLLLGSSETIGGFKNLFTALDNKHKIFAKKAMVQRTAMPLFNHRFETVHHDLDKSSPSRRATQTPGSFDIQKEADRLLLTSFTPASVLINEDMEILQFRGHTNQFLEPASGTASFNLMKMAKEGLSFPLQSSIQKARKLNVPVTHPKVAIPYNDGTIAVTLEVIPVKAPMANTHYFLVLFKIPLLQENNTVSAKSIRKRSTIKPATSDIHLTQVKQELAATKEYLQSVIEEQEATNEELKSSNEEILSSNEELQSTNEELETAKEELQSTNEELTTLNQEILTRNVELTDTLEYIQSIVSTVREPLLILTSDLRVKNANTSFYKTFNVSATDTEGKLLYDLGGGQWAIPELKKLLEEILLQNNQFQDFEVSNNFPSIGHKVMLLNARKIENMKLILLAIEDITLRRTGEKNFLFLAEASRILSSSLDYQTTLNNVAKLAVPEIADWCAIDILRGKGLQLVAVAHKDPKKVRWAKKLRKVNPVDMNAPTGLPNVIRTGKPEIYPSITDELLVKVSRNKKELELVRSLGFTSAMIVPLCSDKKCIGGITFVTTETRKHYTKEDLVMAEELANRASVALENAGLYKASQDAITLRDDFISVASHELKTPVTSVKMFTQVLKHHSQQIGDEKAVDQLSKMDKQLNKLTELIYDLLNISKIQAGKMAFKDELFDFDKAIKEVAEVLQQSATKHKIIIVGQTKKQVRGDEERLGQVLNNLISNAIKYSPRANKVVITLSTDKENVTVAVEDFGIGMENEHLGRIFERFYRVYDATDKTFPGLGIGLYISSEIVKRHGGKFWVESNIGKGSTFYFSIPIKGNKLIKKTN